MTIMIAELYDALLEAGASDEKSRKAAEAMASYEQRFQGIDTQFVQMGNRLERIEERLGAMETRFEERLGAMETRFEERLGAMETRFEERLGILTTRFEDRVSSLPTKAEYAALEIRLTRWIPAMAAIGGLIGSLVLKIL